MTPNKRSLAQADIDLLVEEMKHHFATKSDLDNKLANYATKDDLTKLRQDMIGDKVEILAAINKKDENDTAHQMLHQYLGDDVPKLQQQVHHRFKTFEIKDPTEVVPSY